jgi:ABC-2 type transport system ATP-binding protein
VRKIRSVPQCLLSASAKSYRVYQKKEGLRASMRGLFRRQYREVQAVRGIDLTVEQGEFVAFLGPNGAGKTTTLKLLSGVINPTFGRHGAGARPLETRKRLPPALRPGDGAEEPALVGPAGSGVVSPASADLPDRSEPSSTHARRADRAAGRARLLGQPVRELSLGERMKMELIAALLHSPEVLFLDEPTIGLDVVAQHNIQQFLKHYQQQRKITILLTSHYMKDVGGLVPPRRDHRPGADHYDGSLRDRRSLQRPQDRDAAVRPLEEVIALLFSEAAEADRLAALPLAQQESGR